MKHTLESYGWDAWFEERFAPFAALGFKPARVAVEHRTKYELYGETGLVTAVLAGKLRYTADQRNALPAVGDWVAAAPRPEGEATIHGVLPRRSAFARRASGGVHAGAQVAAANVDVAFLVTSCNLDFNPRRLERYLATAWESGASPVLVLSKADLAKDLPDLMAQARALAGAAPVIALSATTGRGIDDIRGFLAGGKTGALLGSSGVGKSTLINRLLGEERLLTAAIRDYDDKGRHTTTRRELVLVPGGGLLIDTPGMRELAVPEGEDGMLAAFSDVTDLALACAFADCSHGPEPGCAVTTAVAQGQLPPQRVESFKKLMAEQLERRRYDTRADAPPRGRSKAATKAARTHVKKKRG